MKYCKLAFFMLIISFSACEKERPVDLFGDTVYIEDNIFGCDQFETMDVDASFIPNQGPSLEVFNQFFAYGTSDSLVIREGFNGPALQSVGMRVHEMKVFENQIIICAQEGLYSLRPTGEIITVDEGSCNSMVLDGQNRLLIAGDLGNGGPSSSSIYEYKNNTVEVFISGFLGLTCTPYNLYAGTGQSLYVVSCDDGIAYFENGVLQKVFEAEELPFTSNSSWPLYLGVYHNGSLITIGEDSNNFNQVYKLTGETWHHLYDLSYQNAGAEVDQRIFYGNIYHLRIHDDYLYTFTTNGSQDMLGINRFDIANNQLKGLDDVDRIQIPGLEARDVIDIIVASDGHAYAILNSGKIVKISC